MPNVPVESVSVDSAQLRIFVVEDDPDARRTLQMYLRRLGHFVTCAAGLSEAIHALAQDQYDALIADIGLRDGSGWDLMAQLRSRGIACPPLAVAMSGFGMREDHARSQTEGFAAHLVKPLDLRKLTALLAQAAGQRAARMGTSGAGSQIGTATGIVKGQG